MFETLATDEKNLYKAAVGTSQFTIKFNANATTGFKWHLKDTAENSCVKLVSSEYQRPKPSDMVGVPGMEVMTFKVVGEPGCKENLTAHYAQPWMFKGFDEANSHLYK